MYFSIYLKLIIEQHESGKVLLFVCLFVFVGLLVVCECFVGLVSSKSIFKDHKMYTADMLYKLFFVFSFI